MIITHEFWLLELFNADLYIAGLFVVQFWEGLTKFWLGQKLEMNVWPGQNFLSLHNAHSLMSKTNNHIEITNASLATAILAHLARICYIEKIACIDIIDKWAVKKFNIAPLHGKVWTVADGKSHFNQKMEV